VTYTATLRLMLTSTAFWLFSSAALAAPCSFRNESLGTTKSEFDAGCLKNGVRFVIDRNPSLPASIMLVVNGGLKDEERGQGSASHVIEHIGLIRPAGERGVFQDLVAREKISLLGGSTGYRSTSFYVGIDHGFNNGDYKVVAGLISEWLTAMPISERSLTRERASVSAESVGAGELKPFLDLSAAIYGSRAGETSAQSLNDLEKLKFASVMAFYRKWYRPDLATVIITGDIDVAKWKSALESEVGIVPLPKEPNPRQDSLRLPTKDTEPTLTGFNRVLIVPALQGDTLRIVLATKSPSPKGMDAEGDLRTNILKEIVTEALNIEGLESDTPQPIDAKPSLSIGPFMAADIDAESMVALTGLPYAKISDYTAVIERVVQRNVQIIRGLKQFGLPSSTIYKAKKEIARRKTVNVVANMADYANESHRQGIYKFPNRSLRAKIVSSITNKEINSYLSGIIDLNKDFDVAISAPDFAGAPDKLSAAAQKGLERGRMAVLSEPSDLPYLTELFAGLPASQAPSHITQLDFSAESFELPSGHKVILKRIAPSGSEKNYSISIEGAGPNNIYAFSQSKYFDIKTKILFTPLNINAELTNDFLASEGIDFRMQLMPKSSILQISGFSDSLSPVLQAARLAIVPGISAAPRPIRESVSATMAGAKPLPGRVGEFTDYAALQSAVGHFKPRTIVVCGDFDLAEARQLVMRYLGDLAPVDADLARRSQFTMEPLSDVFRNVEVSHRGKYVQRIYSADYQGGPRDDAALAILSEILDKSLFSTFRAAGGYSADALHDIWKPDLAGGKSVADLKVAFVADDALIPKFDALAEQVVSGLASSKIDRKIFERAKREVARKAAVELGDPVIVSRSMLDAVYKNRSLTAVGREEVPIINQVTLSDVQRMAGRFLRRALSASKPLR
jgi:predicted Zn-dependent peptidase